MRHPKSIPCPECGGEATLTTGAKVYTWRPDLADNYLWQCACGARCGCHGDTKVPLGTPANEATRKARMAAHAAFDPIWKRSQVRGARRHAYAKLAEKMDMTLDECHIGMMTAAQAAKVVEICREGLFK